MVISIMQGLFQIMAILSPENDQQLDEYCTGMTFGLQGSKLLVSIANVFIGQDGKLKDSPLSLDKNDI